MKRYRHEPAFMVVDQAGEYAKAEELISTLLVYERALRKISAIEDSLHGGDWDEIEEARTIANAALLEVN